MTFRSGVLRIVSWAGTTERIVQIVGETPRRYRIRALVETWLPNKCLKPGQEALVPKTAVRIEEATR